ncbi:MAG TPA: hypothetical protein VF963_01105 [Gaiellaceae bacterium]
MSRQSRNSYRPRFIASYALVALAGLALSGGAFWRLVGTSTYGAGSSACSDRIPVGESISTAWNTTALFVADVILNRSPACGYDLSTEHLRAGRSRAEWASGLPVQRFTTRYPPVPIARASRDPAAPQAVYILSRREAEFVVPGATRRPEIPMMVGLAAPDAGLGAYNLVLIVEDGSWRVDRVRRVHFVHRTPATQGSF